MEERQEVRFGVAGDGVVVALVGGRKDGVSGRLDVVDLFDVMGEEIRQAELVIRRLGLAYLIRR